MNFEAVSMSVLYINYSSKLIRSFTSKQILISNILQIILFYKYSFRN